MRRVFEQTVRNTITNRVIGKATLVYDETEDYFDRPAFTLELIRQAQKLLAAHAEVTTEEVDED